MTKIEEESERDRRTKREQESSRSWFFHLDHKLTDTNSPYRKKIAELLIGTGADKGYKNATRALFKVVFDNSLLAQFCWLGNEKKLSLFKLKNLMSFFESHVKLMHPSWTGNDFSLVVRNFVKNCPASQNKK